MMSGQKLTTSTVFITNDTPKHRLTAGNLLRELKTAAGLNTNKIETNWRTVMRMVKKFLCAFPIHSIRILSMIIQ